MFSKLYLLLLLILYYVPIVSQSHSRQEIFCTFWSTVIFNKKCYCFLLGVSNSSWGVLWPRQSTCHHIVSKLGNNNNEEEEEVCSLLRTYWVPHWHAVSLIFTTPRKYGYAHFTENWSLGKSTCPRSPNKLAESVFEPRALKSVTSFVYHTPPLADNKSLFIQSTEIDSCISSQAPCEELGIQWWVKDKYCLWSLWILWERVDQVVTCINTKPQAACFWGRGLWWLKWYTERKWWLNWYMKDVCELTRGGIKGRIQA